jgi:peptidyl-tRNA hydrolase
MSEVKSMYDDPEQVQARKNQTDPWVLYLIVRESLGMGVGKVVAQGGHAVGMIYEHRETLNRTNTQYVAQAKKLQEELDKHSQVFMYEGPSEEFSRLVKEKNQISNKFFDNEEKLHQLDQWRQNSFRKVVLRANDKEFEKIKAELECFVVRDAGLTEVAPGSETVIALWPMKKSEVPKLIQRLQVLK